MKRCLLLLLILTLLLCGCGKKETAEIPPPETARIAVLTGTLDEQLMERLYPNADLMKFDNMSDCVVAVQTYQADYLCTAWTTEVNYIRKNPDLAIMDDTLQNDDVAIAVNKSETELYRQLNNKLHEYNESGLARQIVDHWVRPDGSDYVIEEIPVLENGRELHIAISAQREPMCFVMDGEFAGVDIELISRLCYDLGYIPVFEDMKYSAMIPSVLSDVTPIAISNIGITKERAESVNFTESYMTNPRHLLTRKESIPLSPGNGSIAVPGGSAMQQSTTDTYPFAVLTACEDEKACLEMIASGKADYAAVAADTFAALDDPIFIQETRLEDGTVIVSCSKISAGESFWEMAKTSFEKTFLREHRWKLVLEGVGITLLISVGAAPLGMLIGALFCGMRRSRKKALSGISYGLTRVLQGTPVVVLLMIFYYLVFNRSGLDGVVVSIFAFALDFGAYSGEIFRSGIESVDKGQLEAAAAIGFNKTRTFRYILLPQAMQNFLPVLKGQFISLVKMTSVVGYVAVQDLTKVGDIIRSRTYDAFFPLIMTAVLYFLLSWGLSSLLSVIEIEVDPRRRKAMRKAKARRKAGQPEKGGAEA